MFNAAGQPVKYTTQWRQLYCAKYLLQSSLLCSYIWEWYEMSILQPENCEYKAGMNLRSSWKQSISNPPTPPYTQCNVHIPTPLAIIRSTTPVLSHKFTQGMERWSLCFFVCILSNNVCLSVWCWGEISSTNSDPHVGLPLIQHIIPFPPHLFILSEVDIQLNTYT